MAMFAVDAWKLRVKVWLNELVVLLRVLGANIFKKTRRGRFCFGGGSLARLHFFIITIGEPEAIIRCFPSIVLRVNSWKRPSCMWPLRSTRRRRLSSGTNKRWLADVNKSAVTGSTYKLKYCTSWREKVMNTVVSVSGVSECWNNQGELNGIDIAKTYNTRTDG